MKSQQRQLIAQSLLQHEPPSFAALAQVQEVFSLTGSEIRFVGLLASGYTIEECATIMRVTIDSARTYSKHVYGKTGAHTQAQLVCIAMRAQLSAA